MHFPGYALLIGAGTTQSRLFASLPVTNDIEALKAVLVDPGICGYAAENIMVLTDAQATAANIGQGLAWLTERSAQNPGAPILLYYSGHGWSDIDDHYYLIQYDVSDEDLSATAYAAQTLIQRLGTIAARQMVIVLDCCRAGGVAEGKDISPAMLAKGRDTAPPVALQTLLSQGGSRVVFASSLEGQKSWFHPRVAISLFTYYFLEGLQGGNAKANDTQVHIDQLIGHVSREVEAASRALPSLQTPTFILKGQNFPVALLQGGKGLGPGGWPAAKPEADATIERVVRQITQTIREHGVALGRDANDSIIVPGDHNQVARDNARITTSTQSGGVNASGATFGNNATLAGGNVTQSTITYAAAAPANPPASGIQQVLDLLAPVLTRLEAGGDEEGHDQVQQVILYLRDALRAEQKADQSRRAGKIRQAQAAFAEVDGAMPEVAGLRPLIDQLV
jgi:hypothetical protein